MVSKQEDEATWERVASFCSSIRSSDDTIEKWVKLRERETMEQYKQQQEEVYAPEAEISQLSNDEFSEFVDDVAQDDELYSSYYDMIEHEIERREGLLR